MLAIWLLGALIAPLNTFSRKPGDTSSAASTPFLNCDALKTVFLPTPCSDAICSDILSFFKSPIWELEKSAPSVRPCFLRYRKGHRQACRYSWAQQYQYDEDLYYFDWHRTSSAYGTYAVDYMKKAAISGNCNIIGIMFLFVMNWRKKNVKIGAQNQAHSIVFSKTF